MEFEKQIKADDFEREMVCDLVNIAYRAWAKDSQNPEWVKRLNRSLNEAYETGVRISVKIKNEALEFSECIDKKTYEQLKAIDPHIKEAFTLSSSEDAGVYSRTYRGEAIAAKDSGYLFLSTYPEEDRKITFAFLKPEDIESLTPIRP